jgi:hypothetical protein
VLVAGTAGGRAARGVVAPAIALPWRRTRRVLVTAVVFGAIVLGDAVALLGTGEPIELYAAWYVLLVPYALFRWGSGAEAATGMAVAVAAHALVTAIGGNLGESTCGWPAIWTTCGRWSAPRSTASPRSRSRTRSGTRVTPPASTCASRATATASA